MKLVADHARLGEGSSEGEVYKILWRKDIFVQKLFSTKLLRDEEGKEVPPGWSSFDNEFQVAMKVSHPNIVHCFGFAQREFPEFSMFMELLEEDLESHLLERDRNQELLSFRDSLHVLLQLVAEAMKHLHEMCFVHGDLKPANILLSQLTMPHSDVTFYLVKVADFGCTQRVVSTSGATVKSFYCRIGTPCYVAPEVLRGRTGQTHPGIPRNWMYTASEW